MSGGGKKAKAKAKGKGKATTTASLSNTRKALRSGIGGLEEEEAQASTSASVFGYQAPNCEGIASLPFRLCRKESNAFRNTDFVGNEIGLKKQLG
jgi:hypothetical protein